MTRRELVDSMGLHQLIYVAQKFSSNVFATRLFVIKNTRGCSLTLVLSTVREYQT